MFSDYQLFTPLMMKESPCYHPTVSGRSGNTSFSTMAHGKKEGQELREKPNEY